MTDLLTLAREGQRPTAVAPLALTAAGEAALERWVSVADEHDVDLQLRDRSGGARVDASARGRRGHPRQPRRERDRAHRAADRGRRRARRGPRARHASPSSTPAPGLEPGEEEHVFERFVRGSSRAERPRGSGLGLTIVRVLAERWGGTATIANRPEGGARALVRLPLAAMDAPRPGRDAPPDPDRVVTTVMEDR